MSRSTDRRTLQSRASGAIEGSTIFRAGNVFRLLCEPSFPFMFPNESGSLHSPKTNCAWLNYYSNCSRLGLITKFTFASATLLSLSNQLSVSSSSFQSSLPLTSIQQTVWPTETWPRKFCPIQWICRLNIIFIRSQLDLHTCYVFFTPPHRLLPRYSRWKSFPCGRMHVLWHIVFDRSLLVLQSF